jgi:hypothetical protein
MFHGLSRNQAARKNLHAQIQIGGHVYVRNSNKCSPWIARVERMNGDEIEVTWMYKPSELVHSNPFTTPYCPNELFASTHVDFIDISTIHDIATVSLHDNQCHESDRWCWRQSYNPATGNFGEPALPTDNL